MSLFLDYPAIETSWQTWLSEHLPEISRKWAPPYFILDEAQLRKNIDNMKKAFGDISIAYAMKSNPWLACAAQDVSEYITVCSKGELNLCKSWGIPGRKIALDGVLWDREFIASALELGVARFCVDDFLQLQLLANELKNQDCISILLRVSSGNRFGFSLEEIKICREFVLQDGKMQIVGIQFYPGTQRCSSKSVYSDLRCLEQWLNVLKDELHFPIEEIQFGVGIGVPYFIEENIDEYKALVDICSNFIKKSKLDYRIIFEAGRVISASCGVYLTKVFKVKRRDDKNILFCLGGTNHIQYPGGILGIRTPKIQVIGSQLSNENELVPTQICGSLCSVDDILVRNCMLDDKISNEDWIVFFHAGAYAPSMGQTMFLGMDLPGILVRENGSDLIRCQRSSRFVYQLFEDENEVRKSECSNSRKSDYVS